MYISWWKLVKKNNKYFKYLIFFISFRLFVYWSSFEKYCNLSSLHLFTNALILYILYIHLFTDSLPTHYFFFSTIFVNFWMSSAIRWGSSIAAKWPPRAMVVKLRSLGYFCLTHSWGECMSSLGKHANPVGTNTWILQRGDNVLVYTS